MFVLVLSIIEFLVKVIVNLFQLGVIAIAYIFDPDISLAVKNFVPNLKSVYSYEPDARF